MQTIRITPLIHRGSECIGIYFEKNTAIEQVVRKQPGVKWSQTHTCWYIPLSETGYNKLVKQLKDKALVDNSALKLYLQKKNRVTATIPAQQGILVPGKVASKKPVAITPVWQLAAENQEALEKFVQQLHMKAYSLLCAVFSVMPCSCKIKTIYRFRSSTVRS